MSHIDSTAADPAWPEGYEGARIANLLHFAGLTPDQRLQWLADMLELMQLARQARHAAPSPCAHRPPPDAPHPP